jgi:hypothetical protein
VRGGDVPPAKLRPRSVEVTGVPVQTSPVTAAGIKKLSNTEKRVLISSNFLLTFSIVSRCLFLFHCCTASGVARLATGASAFFFFFFGTDFFGSKAASIPSCSPSFVILALLALELSESELMPPPDKVDFVATTQVLSVNFDTQAAVIYST